MMISNKCSACCSKIINYFKRLFYNLTLLQDRVFVTERVAKQLILLTQIPPKPVISNQLNNTTTYLVGCYKFVISGLWLTASHINKVRGRKKLGDGV